MIVASDFGVGTYPIIASTLVVIVASDFGVRTIAPTLGYSNIDSGIIAFKLGIEAVVIVASDFGIWRYHSIACTHR